MLIFFLSGDISRHVLFDETIFPFKSLIQKDSSCSSSSRHLSSSLPILHNSSLSLSHTSTFANSSRNQCDTSPVHDQCDSPGVSNSIPNVATLDTNFDINIAAPVAPHLSDTNYAPTSIPSALVVPAPSVSA